MAGVSKDTAEAHARFKAKLKLPFPLLADPEKKALTAYGVWAEKNMYGKKVMGVVRSTVVVGPDGKVERLFSKVKAAGHAAKVLETL